MTTATTVAGRTLSGWSRDARHGTWHALLPARSGEPVLGALRVDRALLAPRGTRERLAAAVLAVARLRLPGVLGTVDLVAEAGEVWLITARPPAPTLADLLARGGTGPDAGSAASVLNETAQTLLALHAAGLAHGALAADTVALAPDGVALLAEAGLGTVLGDGTGAGDSTGAGEGIGTVPGGGPGSARRAADVAAWAGLARTLGEAWVPAGTPAAAVFARCRATAGSEGLAAARAALVAGRAALPEGFLRRTELRAAVAAATVTVTAVDGAGVDDRRVRPREGGGGALGSGVAGSGVIGSGAAGSDIAGLEAAGSGEFGGTESRGAESVGAGAAGASARDAGPGGAEPRDAGARDAGARDAESGDADAQAAGSGGAEPGNAGARDAGARGTGTGGTGPGGAEPGDAGARDTGSGRTESGRTESGGAGSEGTGTGAGAAAGVPDGDGSRRAVPDEQLTLPGRTGSRSAPRRPRSAAPDDQATLLGKRNRTPAGPSATPADPLAAAPAGATAPAPTGEGEDDGEILLRFGPGVPLEAQDVLRAQWRTAPVPSDSRPRRCRRRAWIATAAFLSAAAVLLWLLLRPSPAPTVTSVEVRSPAGRLHCGQTADLVGVVTTDGRGGPVTYHWLRSDGHDSGELVRTARRGERRVTVHLRWTVRGPGSFRGTARLRVTHQHKSPEAEGVFSYTCS
ncbi:hypothetical protein ACFRIC_00130 [Streptomyces sp. NPDC056738]|uniref:hypothetical protein n=1 Tax=Streptomyces sp. NPDC056738 TaxID=3345933 RepID=UPI0036AF76DA